MNGLWNKLKWQLLQNFWQCFTIVLYKSLRSWDHHITHAITPLKFLKHKRRQIIFLCKTKLASSKIIYCTATIKKNCGFNPLTPPFMSSYDKIHFTYVFCFQVEAKLGAKVNSCIFGSISIKTLMPCDKPKMVLCGKKSILLVIPF